MMKNMKVSINQRNFVKGKPDQVKVILIVQLVIHVGKRLKHH